MSVNVYRDVCYPEIDLINTLNIANKSHAATLYIHILHGIHTARHKLKCKIARAYGQKGFDYIAVLSRETSIESCC